MRKYALSLSVAIQVVILAAASVVALAAGAGGQNLARPASVAPKQNPGQDEKPKTRHRVPFATEAQPAAGAPQPDIAPFFGNLSVVPVPTNNFVLLRRESDCSLTLLNYTIVISGQGTSVVLNSQTPHYEKTIHANAFLTTTPNVFPKGCVDSIIGTTSKNVIFMGTGKSGAREVAAMGATTVFGINVNTDGTPGPFNVLMPDIAPASVTSGDMNKDGNPDIVSINTDGINSSVSVFLGNADGTYQAANNLELPNIIAQFGAVDDLDGDGNLDVIVNSGNNTFTVFLGKGDGTFKAPVTVSTGASMVFFADSFITADVNGDKKQDIVTSEGLVLLGQGDGMTFTAAPQKAFPATTGGSDQGLGIVAADFNADGKLDLATCDGRAIRIYPGNGDGTFKTGQAYSTIGNRGLIFPTDLDGDGNLDLVTGFVGNGMYSGDDFLENYTYALMGNGDGTFQGAPSLGVQYNGSNLADLNGNGRPDLVGLVGAAQNTFQTYLTGANGIPVPGPTLAGPVNLGVDSWALGDVTGDKVQDLVFFSAAPQVQSYYVAAGNGDGTFQTPTATPLPSLVPSGIDINPIITGLQLADIDHDGNLDLIYSFSDQDEASETFTQGFAVQLGNGKGSFGPPIITTYYSSQNGPTIFFTNTLNAVVDVTGDNFPDVFIVAPMTIVNGTQQVEALSYVGKGDGTFKAPNTLTLTPNIRTKLTTQGAPLTFADLNHDGKMDLVTSGSDSTGSTPMLAISLGNNDGTFKTPTLLSFDGFGFVNATAVADFDGDGKLDIFLNNIIEGTGAGVLLGNGDGTFQTVSNGDGTVSPTELVELALGQGAVAADLKNDGQQDVIAGNTVLLNKSGQTPPVTAATSTSLTAAPNPATAGATVTLTATVTSGTAGTITGTVTFLDGGTSIGTGSVGAGGVATLMTSALAAGSHSITASYGGDANYAGSTTATAVTLVINASTKDATTTTFTVSPNPSISGATVQFLTKVTSTTAGTITGTFTVLDGGTAIGTTPVQAGGVGNLEMPITHGSHVITVMYGGDSTYAASTSGPTTLVVNQATTTTQVSASPNPSMAGSQVTLTATVTPNTAGVVTGSVTFLDGATSIGTGPLSSGVATLMTSSLAMGSHSITANYPGDGNNIGSTSTAITQVVNAAVDFSVAATPGAVTVTAGNAGMVGLTVTPANGSTQAVTFSCTGLPAGAACSFMPPSVTLDGTHAATSQMTIMTTGPRAGVRVASAGTASGSGSKLGPMAASFGVGLLGIFGLSLFSPRKTVRRMALLLAVLTIPVMALVACSGSPGGSGGGGTPTGSYMISVTGTAGTDTHAAPVTLTVD